MAVQEFVNSMVSFFNLCAVYYVIQLLKCVQVSILVFGLVCFLRKTLLKNKVFLKGAVWALFLPALFVGKMKFFYENRIGAMLFSWWAEHCKIHIWINRLYHDKNGFVLLYMRLDSGRFQWPRNASEARMLTRQEYRWLMEGLSIDQPRALRPSQKRDF